jgi:hypothetical protein
VYILTSSCIYREENILVNYAPFFAYSPFPFA